MGLLIHSSWQQLILTYLGIKFQYFLYVVWLRNTDEGSIPEMCICSTLLSNSDIKMVYLTIESKSLACILYISCDATLPLGWGSIHIDHWPVYSRFGHLYIETDHLDTLHCRQSLLIWWQELSQTSSWWSRFLCYMFLQLCHMYIHEDSSVNGPNNTQPEMFNLYM